MSKVISLGLIVAMTSLFSGLSAQEPTQAAPRARAAQAGHAMSTQTIVAVTVVGAAVAAGIVAACCSNSGSSHN